MLYIFIANSFIEIFTDLFPQAQQVAPSVIDGGKQHVVAVMSIYEKY